MAVQRTSIAAPLIASLVFTSACRGAQPQPTPPQVPTSPSFYLGDYVLSSGWTVVFEEISPSPTPADAAGPTPGFGVMVQVSTVSGPRALAASQFILVGSSGAEVTPTTGAIFGELDFYSPIESSETRRGWIGFVLDDDFGDPVKIIFVPHRVKGSRALAVEVGLERRTLAPEVEATPTASFGPIGPPLPEQGC